MRRLQTKRMIRMAGATGLVALALFAGGSAVEADEGARPVKTMLERTLAPERLCTVRFLRHLGWRFYNDSSVRCVTAHGGQPCRRPSVEAARAAGDLRIRLPVPFGPSEARALGEMAPGLADGLASRGAYRHRLGAATRRATERLSQLNKSDRVVFPEIFGLVHSPIFVMRLPEPEWDRRDRLFVPSQSARRALESIYERGAVVDCYVGQSLALFGIQYELHGAVGFDEAFEPEELGVGRAGDHLKTPLGRLKHPHNKFRWRALMIEERCRHRDPVLMLAPHGPLAFVGLAGVVSNSDKSEFTNDNFVIVSVSERALRDMVKGGGQPFLAREMKRLWSAGKGGEKVFKTPAEQDSSRQGVDAILATPVFSEIQIYVHPYGNVPLSRIMKKWLPRTDSHLIFRIYTHGQEDFFFQRYRKAFERRCRERLESAAKKREAPAR